MYPLIDKEKTGKRLKKWMKYRKVTVKDVQEYLLLGSVQSVYQWLEGKTLPSLDNLYALSCLLEVSMDELIVPVDSPKETGRFGLRGLRQQKRWRSYVHIMKKNGTKKLKRKL